MTNVLAILIGAFGVALINALGTLHGFARPSSAVGLGDALIGGVVAIVVHELGHRLVGAALGWRLIRFGVGPFEAVRTTAGWKVRRVPMLWAAFVRQVPSSFDHFRRQKCMTLSGGPLGSAAAALLWWVLAFQAHSAFIFGLLGRMAVLSLLGVLELIPRRMKTCQSDGYSLWQVIRNTEFVDEMRREILSEASAHTRMRYRDWPTELVERSAAGSDPYQLFLAYLRAMDGGRTAAAGLYMRRFLEKPPAGDVYTYCAYEIAYWQATFGEDVEGARRRIEAVPADQELLMRRRVEAAIALAEGRCDQAESIARDALAVYEKFPDYGTARYEKDQLQLVLERASAGVLVTH